MAGTFTHWMVVEEALDRLGRLPDQHPYSSTITVHSHFVCLGAVGPDYPYLSELLGGFLKVHSWADRMHYENTGEFIRHGIRNLVQLNGQSFDICMAWLCGFAAHEVTDSVIHPVVQATVGPYIFNAQEHRHCELTQDSYIFHEIKGVELAYGEYVRLFYMCSDPADKERIHPALREFWDGTLRASHPTAAQRFNSIDPDSWHKHFLSRIASAADPEPIFRHFAEERNLAYKKTSDITSDEQTRFIKQVRLPGNKAGEFKKDVFDKAVAEVVSIWRRLFADIEKRNSDRTTVYVMNWNLDTGVDEDKQTFWA